MCLPFLNNGITEYPGDYPHLWVLVVSQTANPFAQYAVYEAEPQQRESDRAFQLCR